MHTNKLGFMAGPDKKKRKGYCEKELWANAAAAAAAPPAPRLQEMNSPKTSRTVSFSRRTFSGKIHSGKFSELVLVLRLPAGRLASNQRRH